MLYCPSCKIPILDPTTQNEVGATTICAKCHFKYLVQRGRVVGRMAILQELRRETLDQKGAYRVKYGFELEQNGSKGLVEFFTDGPNDWIGAYHGDMITTLSTMRGEQIEEVVFIHNESSSQSFQVSTPGSTSTHNAFKLSGVLSIVLFLFVAWAFKISFFAALLFGVFAFIALFFTLLKLTSPRIEEGGVEHQSAAAKQRLLTQKGEYISARETHIKDKAQKGALVDRLRALHTKMQLVDSQLYGHRMATIGRGIGLLEQQMATDQKLIDQYTRLVSMIEIEVETMTTTDILPDSVAAMLMGKSEELETLKEQIQQFEIQLAANDEVARLLR